MQRMAVDDLTPDMPPIRTPWIIDHLMDLGPSEAGAMGPVPISWASIDHWQHCSGIDLQPWTTRLLRRLSVDFVAEMVRAREPDCPPPWTATSSLNRDEGHCQRDCTASGGRSRWLECGHASPSQTR